MSFFFILKKKQLLSVYHLFNEVCEQTLREMCEHILTITGPYIISE